MSGELVYDLEKYLILEKTDKIDGIKVEGLRNRKKMEGGEMKTREREGRTEGYRKGRRK